MAERPVRWICVVQFGWRKRFQREENAWGVRCCGCEEEERRPRSSRRGRPSACTKKRRGKTFLYRDQLPRRREAGSAIVPERSEWAAALRLE